ncbi:MAG: hypothetical protein NC048_02755 [Bacteroides sp.]|nr:hypothetical protein [Bacteroides sp.]MCM1531440.1 hypothetical protein [Ruminococcus flavefaciens]MCM1554398.1 hypothetical protein [Bacteroides sp.]
MNQEKIYDRGEAYRYVLCRDNGTTEELESHLSQDIVEDFFSLGYIQRGMDGGWNKRWKLTDFGRIQLNEYVEILDQKLEMMELLSEF